MGMYYCFVGQNATTGKPNRITGHYSNYGRFYKFATKALRDQYVEEFRSCNPSEFCKACNIKTGRQYSLGQSVRDYLEYLEYGAHQLTLIDRKWECMY